MTTGPDTGTYEVLRDRLTAQAAELARRAEALDSRRVEEFGATRLELTGTGHLRTAHTCVPRDLVALGDVLLLGHHALTGRGPDTAVDDVFALHDRDLNRLPDDAVPGLLDDPGFVREFKALHRYYSQARLLRLSRVDGRLLAVFRTGAEADDIRVLRWALADDGQVSFLDARGDRDHVPPPAHDFTWTATTREDHVLGRHPHVSVEGELFVTTVGGALTLKTEDDTETGEGIHSEPVDEPLQALADADIAYARVGALILFAASFVENALTANPVLAPLAGRPRADLDLLVRLAGHDPAARADRLTHPYAPAELERVLAVLGHLLTVRETVLAVNAAYLASAAQSEATRTEPPFRLQGSYRNMNKIAQRVQPVMNAAEVAALIDDHYRAEAQTLTTGVEAGLLKLAELRGTLTPGQAARWSEVKAAHVRTLALGGPEDAPLVRAVAALGLLADRIAAVESAISRAADPRTPLAHPNGRHAAHPVCRTEGH